MKLRAVVLTLVLSGMVGQLANAAPSVYLKLKANGAEILGDSPVASLGRADSIQCLSFSMGVSVPRAAGGQLAGKRQYEPLVITKPLDRSSVLLLKALTDNQVCECEFRFFRPGQAGADQHYYTVTLGNAYISAVHQRVPESGAGVVEEVEFTYEDITWTWVDGGLQHQDKVTSLAAGGGATSVPLSVTKPVPPFRPRIQGTPKPKPEG